MTDLIPPCDGNNQQNSSEIQLATPKSGDKKRVQ